MVDLLITRKDLRRAVCYFLAVDHEVYGYDLNDCFAGVGLGMSQFHAARHRALLVNRTATASAVHP